MIRLRFLLPILLISALALAQGPPPPPGPPGPGPGGNRMMMHQRGMRGLGRWWKNADVVKQVGISDEQVQKMEQIFQQHRLKLIDLKANLERDEVKLQPLVEADNPNEQAVMSQIDKVAAARAELEKSNAAMMFAIRRVLTPEQWKKLQDLKAQRPGRMRAPMPPPEPKAPPAEPGSE